MYLHRAATSQGPPLQYILKIKQKQKITVQLTAMCLKNFVFLVIYYSVSNVVGLGAVSCLLYYNNLPSLPRAATNPGPHLMRVLCSPDSSPVFPCCVKMLLGENSLLSSNHRTDMLTRVSLFISPSPTHTPIVAHTCGVSYRV